MADAKSTSSQPINLQRGMDNYCRHGINFSVTPLIHLHPGANRDDVIALAASRADDIGRLLEVLVGHSDSEVARVASLIAAPMEDVLALLNAANDVRRWQRAE